jgi:hypothetical protein
VCPPPPIEHHESTINPGSAYTRHTPVCQRVRPASLPTFRHSTIHATLFLHAFAIFGALRNSPSDRNFGGRLSLSRGLARLTTQTCTEARGEPSNAACSTGKKKRNQLSRRAAVCPVLSSGTRLSRPHLFVFALHLPHSSALACSRKCHQCMHVHILGFLAALPD